MKPKTNPQKCHVEPQEGNRLDMCPKGSNCVIQELTGASRARLAEMGLTSGTQVKIINCAACNGPIILEVRGYNLSIRKEEAHDILIKTEDIK